MHVAPIDYAILAAYFVVVLGIGFYLKSRMRKSSDFLLAGRHIPAWAAGLVGVDGVLRADQRDQPGDEAARARISSASCAD